MSRLAGPHSNTLLLCSYPAAALWTLDAAFEAAAAGSVGINLHQGAGQNLYTAIVRREIDGVLKPAVLRPSFYGMLLCVGMAWCLRA